MSLALFAVSNLFALLAAAVAVAVAVLVALSAEAAECVLFD